MAPNARRRSRFARAEARESDAALDAVPARHEARRVPAPLAVVVGMAAAEILRQGAFYARDAFGVALLSAALIAYELAAGVGPRARRAASAIGASAAWWWVAAVVHGPGKAFLPLGAGMLGFLAGFLVVRRLDDAQRAWAAAAIATIGAAAGAIGLEASVTRRFPLAMPAQDLWRLSTTLTYADAAGLLVGMALLLAVSLDQRRWLPRVDVYLCTAALVATQSRGAVLAVAAGAVLVPMATARAALRPLLAGIAGGLVVVATSSGPGKHASAGITVIAGLVFVAVVRPPSTFRRVTISRRTVTTTVLVTACCAIVASVALRTPIQRRVELSSTNDRVAEWTAAVEQWRSSPFTGTGPDKVLRFHDEDGRFARFAHNEYLQVAAGAGVIGLVLLLLAIGTVAAALRRDDRLSSCACGALVAFVVAGFLDFDWHLSVLGLVAGCAAGIAARPERSVPTRAPPPAAVASTIEVSAPPEVVGPPSDEGDEQPVTGRADEAPTSRWHLSVAMPEP